MKIIKLIKKNTYLFAFLSKVFNLYGLKKKIKGANNTVIYDNTYLKNVKVIINGEDNYVKIGRYSKLNHSIIYIEGSHHKLVIGESCIISNTKFSISQKKGRITFGENSTINGGLLYSGEGQDITIGKDCMFSSNIDVRTTDSHSIIDLHTNKRINEAKKIEIGDHVWLGNSCRVLKGVVIREGSVIGAGSVVTKNIDRNSVAVGIPAKKVMTNILWDRNLL